MTSQDLDTLITHLLPQVLADRDLGDGRTFTSLHMRNLWALSCLHAGRCYDESMIEATVVRHLPSHVLIAREVSVGRS